MKISSVSIQELTDMQNILNYVLVYQSDKLSLEALFTKREI